MFHFYNPWKSQKTKGFLTFSGGTEMEYWHEMGYIYDFEIWTCEVDQPLIKALSSRFIFVQYY